MINSDSDFFRTLFNIRRTSRAILVFFKHHCAPITFLMPSRKIALFREKKSKDFSALPGSPNNLPPGFQNLEQFSFIYLSNVTVEQISSKSFQNAPVIFKASADLRPNLRLGHTLNLNV